MNPRISRRHFLITGSGALGACFLPAWLLRRARDLEESTGEVLIEPPATHRTVLHAVPVDDGWQFALGGPIDELPRAPSWREYLADYVAIDPHDPAELARWFEEQCVEPPGPGDAWLGEKVPEHVWDSYIEWQFAIYDSPAAQAFHYLHGLDLSHRSLDRQTADPFGELQFYAGPMPGSNWHFVQTPDRLVLTALQHRLRELGEDVALVVG